MKTKMIAAAALVIASVAFGQGMMKSAAGSGGTGSMMMSSTNVDPKVGSELRFAASTGHKVTYTDLGAAKALEKTLSVTVQDTFVQIDATGARLGAWNGGGVDGILAHAKRG